MYHPIKLCIIPYSYYKEDYNYNYNYNDNYNYNYNLL